MSIPMINSGGGGGSSNWTFGMIIMTLFILFLLPTSLAAFGQSATNETAEDVLDDYLNFTGDTRQDEAVWPLTGIFTPYEGDTYGHTEDGWLYGTALDQYSPSQLATADPTSYSVTKSDDFFHYNASSDYGGWEEGDIYTAVTMDVDQKSNVFFTEKGKHEEGGFFYYEYTGYRYSFQPIASYTARASDGSTVEVAAGSTSLSLIWYSFYTASGLSGQLVLSGSSSGVGYISSAEIIRAFDQTTSTASFDMVFNGLDMHVHIRILPYYLTEGYSIKECYDRGFWEVMITSTSADAKAYTSATYDFSFTQILTILFDLFTFNADEYGLTGIAGILATLTITLPLYGTLLVVGLEHEWVLILLGILTAVQTILGGFNIFNM